MNTKPLKITVCMFVGTCLPLFAATGTPPDRDFKASVLAACSNEAKPGMKTFIAGTAKRLEQELARDWECTLDGPNLEHLATLVSVTTLLEKPNRGIEQSAFAELTASAVQQIEEQSRKSPSLPVRAYLELMLALHRQHQRRATEAITSYNRAMKISRIKPKSQVRRTAKARRDAYVSTLNAAPEPVAFPGQVYGMLPAGVPLDTVALDLHWADSWSSPVYEKAKAVVDKTKGAYAIRGVPPGDYVLTFNWSDDAKHQRSFGVGIGAKAARFDISVTPPEPAPFGLHPDGDCVPFKNVVCLSWEFKGKDAADDQRARFIVAVIPDRSDEPVKRHFPEIHFDELPANYRSAYKTTSARLALKDLPKSKNGKYRWQVCRVSESPKAFGDLFVSASQLADLHLLGVERQARMGP
ncbi:MAG: hypothetical protein JXR37_01895 [Kiritimatiellae bacterium]|nr:hypothetical protein [Kiritimatiellia bacterium]